MVITKKEFIQYVSLVCSNYLELLQMERFEGRVMRCYSGVSLYRSNISTVANIVADWDEDIVDYIKWYIYESRGGTEEYITTLNNKCYILKTPEDLWDFLQLSENKE